MDIYAKALGYLKKKNTSYFLLTGYVERWVMNTRYYRKGLNTHAVPNDPYWVLLNCWIANAIVSTPVIKVAGTNAFCKSLELIK